MELRPYQLEAIAGARTALLQGKKRALITCPTGGGKTVIAAEIIRLAVARGSRVLFLAHRRELITQASDKLHRFGVRHGILMAGMREALQQSVQVASVQTMVRRPGRVSKVDLIFLDEAHHVTGDNQYAKLLNWFPEARVVGLTATPWRLDGRGLADVFDAHVLARTPRELRDEGYLVPVGGWEYEGIDTSQARIRKGDFVAGDMQASATSRRVVGDVVTEWQIHAAGKRTVLFACTVEHSQLMAAEFVKAGVPAEHLDGETPTAKRDAILQRLRTGQTLVVCNCNVLTEGFDCPELEVAILARPTLSLSLCLQMVGRILRPAEGKTMARIHDHAGCLAAHGHPYAERDYSPTTTAKASRKDAEEGGGTQKRCPACKSVRVGWPCDACGFSPTPQELKIEYDEVARKREITNNGSKPKPKETDDQRREKWCRRFAHDEEWKWGFFARMVEKHGIVRAPYVYWWFSGKSERPPGEWIERLRHTSLAQGASAERPFG